MEVQLSLTEFVEMRSPLTWAELNSINVKERYPFARSLDDFEEEALRKATDLPFVNPEAAEAAMQKRNLERLVWRDVCSELEAGQWECQARPENELNWQLIPARVLIRAVPNFASGSLYLFGDLYEDVAFARTSPLGADEKALEVIQRF